MSPRVRYLIKKRVRLKFETHPLFYQVHKKLSTQ